MTSCTTIVAAMARPSAWCTPARWPEVAPERTVTTAVPAAGSVSVAATMDAHLW